MNMERNAMETVLRTKSHAAGGKWQTPRAQLLQERSLAALFADEIPAIILPKFILPSDCETIVANLRRLGMGTYSHVNHAVGRLGLAQMEYHINGDKAGYFARVSEAQNTYMQAIGTAKDPTRKLIDFLSHA